MPVLLRQKQLQHTLAVSAYFTGVFVKILENKHAPGSPGTKQQKRGFRESHPRGNPSVGFAAFILVTAVVSADVSPFPVSPVQPVELGTATPPSLLPVHSLG